MSKETDLGGHNRDGKYLHPPFKKLENMVFSSWKDHRMPDMLWAVLAIGNWERSRALSFFRYIASFIENNPEYSDITLTGIGKLSPEKRLKFIEHILRWSPDVRELLQTMLIFPKLPGREEWQRAIGEPNLDKAGEIIATAVKEVLWHQSEKATDCRWIKFICLIHSGKIKFSSSIEGINETLKGVFEYPDYGDIAHVRGFVRSGEIGFSGKEQTDISWPNHFWEECYKKTACIPESAEVKFPHSPEEWDKRREHYSKETARVRKSLITHYFDSLKTTAIDSRFETVFGLVLYSQTLLDEIAIFRLNFSVAGRLTLRSIVESYITLAYLLQKDDEAIWNAYREYGSGQAKLVHLKLKELTSVPSSIDAEMMDRIANEDKWQEFTSINIGHWDDSNLRKLAEDVGLKEVYDQYYNWSSGYIHANWAAIRETTYQSCLNPLHRLHRIPAFALPTLPDVLKDGVEISNKMIDLLAKFYPTYSDRVKIFTQ